MNRRWIIFRLFQYLLRPFIDFIFDQLITNDSLSLLLSPMVYYFI